MPSFKTIVKALTPPIFALISNRFKKKEHPSQGWTGNYTSWQQAMAHCTGYDDVAILQKCKNSLLKVKNGEAVYERDSVIFDQKQYSWGLLAALQNCAIETGALNVLDFGGSLGSSYYQNREFLLPIKNVAWCIVEQAHFVDCGKKYFESGHLKFYHTVDECIANHQPTVLLLSSVLQYLAEPYKWIEKLIALKIPNIILDRTGFTSNINSILTIQNVPEEIYKASYPCWFFNEKKLIAAFLPYYDVVADFDDCITSSTEINEDQYYWKGFYLKIKS